MDFTLIVAIILFVLIVIGIFKLFKSVLKTVILSISILSLVIIALGFIMYVDSVDFKDNFPVSENLLLLEDKGEIITGSREVFAEEKSEPVTEEDITAYNGYFRDKDYSSILGDSYKVFIINMRAFDNLPEEAADDEGVLTKSFTSKLLVSDDPLSEYADEVIRANNWSQSRKDLLMQDMLKQISGNPEFKSILFRSLMGKAMEDEGPRMLLRQFKKGNIIIYPETATFKFIRVVPNFVIDKIPQPE